MEERSAFYLLLIREVLNWKGAKAMNEKGPVVCFARASSWDIPACKGVETPAATDGFFKWVDPKFKELGLEKPDNEEDFDSLNPEIHPKNGGTCNLCPFEEFLPGTIYSPKDYVRLQSLMFYGVDMAYFVDAQIKAFLKKIDLECSIMDGFVFILKKKVRFCKEE